METGGGGEKREGNGEGGERDRKEAGWRKEVNARKEGGRIVGRWKDRKGRAY